MEERRVIVVSGLLHTSAYVSIRTAYVSIRQNTSAYVSTRMLSIRQHSYVDVCDAQARTSAYVLMEERSVFACGLLHASAYVSIRTAYVSIRTNGGKECFLHVGFCIRQHTYSIRTAYVSIRTNLGEEFICMRATAGTEV
jgi:hypothetical protein